MYGQKLASNLKNMSLVLKIKRMSHEMDSNHICF